MDKALADKTSTVIQNAERQTPEPGQGRRDPEILAELFAPEVVLPEQMLAGARRGILFKGGELKEQVVGVTSKENLARLVERHLTK